MSMELPNGKTARNLQEQVKFLTEKLKDLYAAFNELGIKKIEIVDALPDTGEDGVLYLLALEDPEEGNYYDEYIWLDNAWEQIGTTQIDLSDYCTLSTDQTITGVKSIQNGMIFIDSDYDSNTWKVSAASQYNLIFNKGGTNRFLFQNNQFSPADYQNPQANLGSANYSWKDLYLGGSAYIGAATIQDSGTYLQITGRSLKTGSHDPVDSASDLGNSTLKWRNAYFSGDVNIGFCRLRYSTGLQANDKIYPNATNTYDLGTSTYAWKDLYLSGVIDLGDGAKISKDSSNRINLSYSNTTKIKIGGTGSYVEGFWAPDANNSYDLGRTSARWKDLYLEGNLSDGTNTAAVSDIIALITYAKAQGWIS